MYDHFIRRAEELKAAVPDSPIYDALATIIDETPPGLTKELGSDGLRQAAATVREFLVAAEVSCHSLAPGGKE